MILCLGCQAENSDFNLVCRRCGENLDSVDHRVTLDPPAPVLVEEPEASAATIGDYEIEAKLGDGGMGEVFKARDPKLNRLVALKLLRQDRPLGGDGEKQRLLAEARMISQMNHPNIVTVFEVQTETERPFIAMEWVQGVTLDAALSNSDSATRLDVALAIAKGLAAAHEAGLIHRDIKPGNIMVDHKGAVKILDFGLAHARDQSVAAAVQGVPEQDLARTAAGVLVGTPLTMSPEQARGKPLTPATDVFSFGVVLYYLLTETMPFQGQTLEELLVQIAQHHPPAPATRVADLPVGLSDLVMDCLAKDSGARPAEMGVVAARLTDIHRAALLRRMQPKRRLLPGLALITLLVALLVWHRPEGVPDATRTPPEPPAIATLALLPLANLTGDPMLDIYCAGAGAELTAWLEQVGRDSGAWVLPHAELRGKDSPSPADLYRRYGLRYVVSGDLRYEGEAYRLTFSLVDAAKPETITVQSVTLAKVALFQGVTELAMPVLDLLGWSGVPPPARETSSESDLRLYLTGLSDLYRFDRPGNLERAIENLRAVVSRRPQDLAARLALAEAYRVQFELHKEAAALEQATAVLNDALRLQPNLPHVLAALGRVAALHGRYETAERVYQQALDQDQNYGPALYGMARVSVLRGRLEAADPWYARASEAAPNDWIGQTEMGYHYFRQGRFAQAEPIFERLTERAPNNQNSHANLGVIRFYAGRPDEALASVARALALEPAAWLYSTHGAITFYLGRYQASAADFEKAIELQPEVAMFHGNLGDAFRHGGDAVAAAKAYRTAVALLEKELAVNPDHVEHRCHQALYLAKMGESARARAVFETLPVPKDPVMRYRHGLIRLLLGEETRALDDLSAAVEGGYPFFEVAGEPEWTSLRTHPRYVELAARFQ